MERVRRPYMSAAEKAEVWRRWKRGESVSDIGRALGRIRKSVHRVIAAHGGVPPRARTRSTVGADGGRARGDLTRAGHRLLVEAHRRPAWARPVDRQPGSATTWGPDALSGIDGRMSARGIERGAPSGAGWRPNQRCAASWPRSSLTIGRRSRLLGGSHGPFRGILDSTCRTRRST